VQDEQSSRADRRWLERGAEIGGIRVTGNHYGSIVLRKNRIDTPARDAAQVGGAQQRAGSVKLRQKPVVRPAESGLYRVQCRQAGLGCSPQKQMAGGAEDGASRVQGISAEIGTVNEITCTVKAKHKRAGGEGRPVGVDHSVIADRERAGGRGSLAHRAEGPAAIVAALDREVVHGRVQRPRMGCIKSEAGYVGER
jgi:hypothetical protein